MRTPKDVPKQRRFDIVDGECVTGKDGLDPAIANQSRDSRTPAGVNDNRAGDRNDLFALCASLPHESRCLGDGSLHLALRGDLVAHEREGRAVALLRFRDNADTLHADNYGITSFDVA